MRFFSSKQADKNRTGRRTPLRARRPVVDLLEGRTLLSTLTVMNAADNGAGSLRQTIIAANSGDTIVFAPALQGSTINLTGSELMINKSLDIEGPGRDLLTISAGGKSRVFEVTGNTSNVTIAGMTVRDGKADVGGGIKDTAASLSLNDVFLSNNLATGGKGGTAQGGGLYAADSAVTLSASFVMQNKATPVAVLTRSTTPTGDAAGGGIEVQGGSLDLVDTWVTENVAVAGSGSTILGGAGDGHNAQGGGIDYNADLAVPGHMSIVNSVLEFNQAPGGSAAAGAHGGKATGGAVAVHTGWGSNTSVFMFSDYIVNNTAQGGSGNGGTGGDATGGGVMVGADSSTSPSVWLQDMTVTKNLAQGGDGGATALKTGNGGRATGAGLAFDAGSSVDASFNVYSSDVSMNNARGGAGGNALAYDGGAGGSAEAAGLMNEAAYASHPVFTLFEDTFKEDLTWGGAGGDGASAAGGGMSLNVKGNGGSGGFARAGAVSDMGRLADSPSFVVELSDFYADGAIGGKGGRGGGVTNANDAAGQGGYGGQAIVGGLFSEAVYTPGASFSYTGDSFEYSEAVGGNGGAGGVGGASAKGGSGGHGGEGYGAGLGFLGGPVNNISFTLLQSSVTDSYVGGGRGGDGGMGAFGGGKGGDGGASEGAGIDISGGAAGFTDEIVIDAVTFTTNTVQGGYGGNGGSSTYAGNDPAVGHPGNGGNGGSARGGAIYDGYYGILNVLHSSLTANAASHGVHGGGGNSIKYGKGSDGVDGIGIGGGVYIALPPGQGFAVAFDTKIFGNQADANKDVFGNLTII